MGRKTAGARLSASLMLNSLCITAALASGPNQAIAQDGSNTLVRSWEHLANADMAMVKAAAGQTPPILGIQCDVNDARSRKLVFGVHDRDRVSGFAKVLMQVRPATLRVAVEAQSSYSEFVVDVEELGRSGAPLTGTFATGYLTSEQYGLIRSARSIAVIMGNKDYVFTGAGSLAATTKLACAKTSPIRASRMIARTSVHPQGPTKAPWTFSMRSAHAPHVDSGYQASATVLGFPESRLASFRLDVTCYRSRLHAKFAGGAAANNVPGSDRAQADTFIRSLTGKATYAEVYRNGRLMSAFSVDPGPEGRGHPLSSTELATLLDFDALVVSAIGSGHTIEFSNQGSAESIAAAAESCGAGR